MGTEPFVTLSFRALAILERFIEQHIEIDDWLIPGTICFSVPALFHKKKKKIIFYDFGYSPDLIITKIKDEKKQGVLICSYFGAKWNSEDIKKIKSHCTLLIEDACLEIPITNVSEVSDRLTHSDLLLFSTGSAKQLDFGWGAIGYSYKRIDAVLTSPDTDACDINYKILDSKWKKLITHDERLENFLSLIEGDWIKHIPLENDKEYIQKIESGLPDVLNHKKQINEIYRDAIPKSFWFLNNESSWRFNIMADQPDTLIQALFSQKLFASRHYPNVAKIFKNDYSLKNSFIVERHIINLFNDYHISIEQALEIAHVFKYLYQQGKLKPLNDNSL